MPSNALCVTIEHVFCILLYLISFIRVFSAFSGLHWLHYSVDESLYCILTQIPNKSTNTFTGVTSLTDVNMHCSILANMRPFELRLVEECNKPQRARRARSGLALGKGRYSTARRSPWFTAASPRQTECMTFRKFTRTYCNICLFITCNWH